MFFGELFVAEILLLYPYPKRKLFALRMVSALVVAAAIVLFFPMTEALYNNVFYALFYFGVVFACSFAVMFFCFDCKAGVILSACVSGYAVQHITNHIITLVNLIEWVPREGRLTGVIVRLVVYAAYYFLICRVAAKREYYNYYSKGMTFVSCIALLVCIGLTRMAKPAMAYGATVILCTSLYAVTCCVLILILQVYIYNFTLKKTENEVMRVIHDAEKKQFEVSSANMDLLNIKYHDIKQRLDSGRITVEEWQDVKEPIEIYDNMFRTGLKSLDAILYEKNILCRSKSIKLTFMGNGSDFSFMSDIDVYSLFGNILTNAIEAVAELKDPNKKTISIVTEKRSEFVFINAMNYFEGERKFADGLPVTTKRTEQGYHGFGMKSIRNTALKYGGGVKVDAADGVFALSVYLMNSDTDKK